MIKSYFVTPVRFDFGALALLPKELKALGIARPLLITDPGMVATGTAARVLGLLPAGAAMFSDLPGNPSADNVDAAVAAYRAGSHDGLVALGGGSAIDCAKGAAVMATHAGELRDYDIMKVIKREGRAITPAAAPIVAVPVSLAPPAMFLLVPDSASDSALAGRPKSLHRGTVELLLILQVILLGRVN